MDVSLAGNWTTYTNSMKCINSLTTSRIVIYIISYGLRNNSFAKARETDNMTVLILCLTHCISCISR